MRPRYVIEGIDFHALVHFCLLRARRARGGGLRGASQSENARCQESRPSPAAGSPGRGKHDHRWQADARYPRVEGGKAKGAVEVGTKITAKDYITLQGNAYVTIIGQTSVLSIQKAMDLYKATNDRYPKDYNEFMAEIIQANNIALPKLPVYQEYGYDEAQHKLIILEYPDRK